MEVADAVEPGGGVGGVARGRALQAGARGRIGERAGAADGAQLVEPGRIVGEAGGGAGFLAEEEALAGGEDQPPRAAGGAAEGDAGEDAGEGAADRFLGARGRRPGARARGR
ncbi:hypothetical protein [Nannocystis pusilla]|uniref:hypothetical protein n=1 Tax=Nannocystis pusilla TaxID=889268 RepID=UPI003B8153A1